MKRKEDKKLTHEPFKSDMVIPSGTRKTLFVDDVLQLATHICDSWYTAVSHERRIGMVEFIVAHTIGFIMDGKCIIKGKTYQSWSVLRPVVSKLA